MAIKDFLRLRKEIKRRKPKYVRQHYGYFAKLSRVVKWRKPRGVHSKILKRKKGHRKMPEVGYGSPKVVRGLNKDGLKEVRVLSVSDLDLVKDGCVAVIGGTVGKRKRIEILKEAVKKGIIVSNYVNVKEVLKKFEDDLKERADRKKVKDKEKKASNSRGKKGEDKKKVKKSNKSAPEKGKTASTSSEDKEKGSGKEGVEK